MSVKWFLSRNLVQRWREGRVWTLILGLPGFIRHWRRYRKKGGKGANVADWFLQVCDATPSTAFDPHYLYQSAWAARGIASANPPFHVDVGSQIDLVAPLSAFVPVEFIDLRPLRIAVDGLQCVRGSILALPHADHSLPSVSCLHVIEHIGLGRYGDDIDPEGSVKACRELQRVLGRGGSLFVSVPVGRSRVDFNAHRVFSPDFLPKVMSDLRLARFFAVSDEGVFLTNVDPADLSRSEYALGLYRFTKD